MVAEKIRLERLKQNLSQQNMADELGITAAAYSNLERCFRHYDFSLVRSVSHFEKNSAMVY